LVEQLGGRVLEQIGVIGGFTAELPAGTAATLLASDDIIAVTPNAPLQLAAAGWDSASTLDGLDPRTYAGSLFMITNTSGARAMWDKGITGAGIDVALIDSGVVPVEGLDRHAKIINGPDLSFESQSDDLRYLDTFGHGTHLAGIIAGYDQQAPAVSTDASEYHFLGVAPESRIVSIKVADHNGATDVSQVLAGIDWVVQHRTDNGLNIRILNLSFGTNGIQDYVLDPLAFAVEQAWNAGIVVVVAAGNDGNEFALRNPAYDPFVIAVGSFEGKDVSFARPDLVSDFSNCGDRDRSVDILARGRSVLSLRNPGSAADTDFPEATVADRFFLGSGTSQAAAVVSGAAALKLDQRPELTPTRSRPSLSTRRRR
jgi:serine protease AprX